MQPEKDLYKQIIESNENLILFSLDKNYCYTTFNLNYKKHIQKFWNLNIVDGECILDFLKTEEKIKAAKIKFSRALKGESFKLVEKFVDKQGVYHSYESLYSPVLNSKEKIIGISVFVTDITADEKRKLEITKSKSRFKELTDLLPVSVFETDMELNITYANKHAIDSIGYCEEEFSAGINAFQLINTSNHEKIKQNIAIWMTGNTPEINEYQMIRKDGSLFPGLFQVGLRYEADKVIGFRGVIVDISTRKKYEIALKTSEERYRAIFEGVAEGILIAKIKTQEFFYANSSICQMLGYSNDEIIKLSLDDIHPLEVRPKAKDEFKALARGEKRKSLELLFQRKDKSTFIATVSTTLIQWENEECLVGFFTDVTEKHQAEIDRLESIELYRKLFDSSKDAIMTLAPPSWKFTDGNHTILDMFKVKNLEEWTSIGPWIVSPKNQPDGEFSAEKAKQMIQMAMEKGSHFFDWTHQTMEGEPFATTVLLTRVDLPDQQFLQATVRDVTEQKKIEDAIIHQTELQQLLMNISSTYINASLKNIDDITNRSLLEIGTFVEADRAYIFDFEFDAGLCHNIFEWCRSGIKPMIKDSQNINLEEIPEIVNPHKSGDFVYFPDTRKMPEGLFKNLILAQDIKSLLTVPLMDNENCLGFVGFDFVNHHHTYTNKEIALIRLFSHMIVNIKLRMGKQRELEKLLFTTDDQNKRLKEFSYITSHNIRASVANLMGLSNMLEVKSGNEEYLNMLKITTAKLNNTINNLNDLINFENEIEGLEMVECSLSEAVQRVLKLSNQIIKDKQVEIEVNIEESHNVIGFPAYLDSIMHNLISNAIKYGITESSKRIQISANKKSGVFTVADHGLGIDLELNRDKLFKLGSRLHNTSDGQGLGLFMTKRQIEAMGGQINVESQVNIGTTFRVQF